MLQEAESARVKRFALPLPIRAGWHRDPEGLGKLHLRPAQAGEESGPIDFGERARAVVNGSTMTGEA